MGHGPFRCRDTCRVVGDRVGRAERWILPRGPKAPIVQSRSVTICPVHRLHDSQGLLLSRQKQRSIQSLQAQAYASRHAVGGIRWGGVPMNILRPREVKASRRSILGAGLALAILVATPAVASARASSPLDQARQELLVASDLPTGWTSTPSSNNNSSFPGAAQLAKCLGISSSIITHNPPTANSPEFDSQDQLESVSDSVSVYPSAKAARADHAALANAKTPACLTQALNGPAHSSLASEAGPGATVGTILVSRSPASEFAPGSANFTAFIPVTAHGVSLNLELIVVDYVKGRAEQTVDFTSVQNPFPASLAQHLTTVALQKL